jgi:hypothetical protein
MSPETLRDSLSVGIRLVFRFGGQDGQKKKFLETRLLVLSFLKELKGANQVLNEKEIQR